MRLLLILSGLVFLSCEKQKVIEENQAQLAIVHASEIAGEVAVNVAGVDLTPSGFNYGNVSGTSDNIYISVPSGIRQVNINNGGEEILPHFLANLIPGSYNSIFLYDSATSGTDRKPLLFQVNEAPKESADSAYFRFLHLATGIDSISAILANATDTLVLAINIRQPFHYSSSSPLAVFQGPLKQGFYDLLIYDKNGYFLSGVRDVKAGARSCQTILTSGDYDPSGVFPFSLNFIQYR